MTVLRDITFLAAGPQVNAMVREPIVRNTWLLLVFAASTLFVAGALRLVMSGRCSAAIVRAPQFKVVWDEAHGRNAGWKLSQVRDDFDARFVLHGPRGETTSIVPEFTVTIDEGRLIGPRESMVNAYLPLLWNGTTLELEPGTTEATLSFRLMGSLHSRSSFQRPSARQFIWGFRMRYVPEGTADDAFIERTVVVAVEVIPGE